MKFKDEVEKYKKHKTLIGDIILSTIPKHDGIYIVTVNKIKIVEILDTTTAITECVIKGKLKSLIYDKTSLDYKLKCSNKEILYIGKAEAKEGGLRKRICQFINYADGICDNHRGGRALWQIKDWQDILNIYWCEVENAGKLEKHLLKLHSIEHPYKNNPKPYNKISFSYPFANWKA